MVVVTLCVGALLLAGAAVGFTLGRIRGMAAAPTGSGPLSERCRLLLDTAQRQLEQVASVVQQIPEGVLITDAAGRIEAVNPACERATGFRRDELIGQTSRMLRSPRHDETFYRAIRTALRDHGSWQGEIWIRRRDGEIHPEWLSLTTLRDDNRRVTNYIAIISDVEAHRGVKQRLHRLAYYDDLTGLPNRQLFRDRLEVTLAQARRSAHAVAVMFVDLDHFKHVNDTLGHRTGDRILQSVASRIRNAVRESDTIARLGGDEFTVILPELPGPGPAARVARKILNALEQPFVLAGHEFFLSGSIGIALFPDDGHDREALIQHADIAMYRAKELGRNNYQMYTKELSRHFHRRVVLENELRSGLEREQLRLVYQPQVDIRTGRLVGVEALARWEHPRFGSVPPDTFIPIAEETDLIDRIGEWVLRTACREAQGWSVTWGDGFRLAVNVSARQLRGADYVESVRRVLRETALPPSGLALELTESVMAETHATTHSSKLRALSEMGVQITIDDFGTGYSSLGYLKCFAVDKLKIDRSFVHDVCRGVNDGALASMIIAMGHATSMRVTAEGVETTEQLDFLRAEGCDEAQGFLFSRPVSSARMADFCRDPAAFQALSRARARTVGAPAHA